MKRCPVCNRTYSDETLSFCLEDGSLLSAPFIPREEQETVALPNKAELPPTQYYSPAASENTEIPTVVSAKNANLIYERPSETQSNNDLSSSAKASEFVIYKTRMKFPLINRLLMFVLVSLVLIAMYMGSFLPLLIGLPVALAFLAILFLFQNKSKQ